MKIKLAVLVTLLALGGSSFAQQLIFPVAGVATVDVSPAKAPYEVLVNATVTSVVFTNQTPGQLITVMFLQDSTGHAVTFGGNILNACTVSATANALTSCQFQYDARTVQWAGLGGGGGGGITSVATLPALPCTNGTTVYLNTAAGQNGVGNYRCDNGAWTFEASSSGEIYAEAFGIKHNWVVESNGANFTVTSGSATVTCTTCNFSTTAQTGMAAFFTTWTGADNDYSTANAGPLTATTLTVVNNTTITLSQNANLNSGTTNGNVGVLAYGSDDDATGWTAVENAAYNGFNCSVIQIGGITNWTKAHFLTASCRGITGGTSTSKYAGVSGTALGGSTTILFPPWFSGTGCTGGTSTTACTGLGQWQNISLNTLGAAGNITLAKNLFETFNDGSYQNIAIWGGFATSKMFVLNGGAHVVYSITADGGGAPCVVNGSYTIWNQVFCGNGKSSTASLLVNTGATLIDYSSADFIGANGIGISVLGTLVSYGSIGSAPNVASACVQTGTGGRSYLHGFQCNNNGQTTSNAISVTGTGYTYADTSNLGGGATGAAWGCAATSSCNVGPGNIYSANPRGLAPTITGTLLGSGTAAVNAGDNTPEKGSVTITEGAGAVTTGTFILTFNQTFTQTPAAANPPDCHLNFINGTGTWTAPVTAIVTGNLATAMTWTITNGAALVNASTYIVTWGCGAR